MARQLLGAGASHRSQQRLVGRVAPPPFREHAAAVPRDEGQGALGEVAEAVGEVGVDARDDRFGAVAPVLAERDVAQQEVKEEVDETAEASDELRVERIALDPRGEPAEVRFLQERFEELASQAEGEDWRRRKEGAMQQMQSADFWSSPSRFTVLGLAEYMDRVEAG